MHRLSLLLELYPNPARSVPKHRPLLPRGAKLWHSPGVCVCVCSHIFWRRPPLLSLSLTSSSSLHPFSHHNIVFISPLRLNPSLPVHCGKRHFENEIGYINSSAITLAIAFPLYSSRETWLTSTTTTPTFLAKTQGYTSTYEDRPSLTGNSRAKERGEDHLFIDLSHSLQKVSPK